jgi:DNA-binding response OmpR family regulator
MILDRLPTRVLYVEDDDDIREIIAGALGEAGFDVTAEASAETALDRLQASHYEILVTDFNLAHESGGWLLRRAAAKGYLEGTAAYVLTSERHPPGVDGYTVLRKPIDFGVLLATIGNATMRAPMGPVVSLGAPLPVELELMLYVTSDARESQQAIRNLHRALAPYDAARFRVTIIDVSRGGDDAWYQNLEDDRVIVTPTLVRRRPGPKTWMVGTLTPHAVLDQLLASTLGAPGAS